MTRSDIKDKIIELQDELIEHIKSNGIDSPFANYELSLFKLIGGYVLLRFAIFDLTYNLVRRLPIFYIGETKLYDKLWRKFFSWSGISSEHLLFMVKLIALLISVSWLLDINRLIEKL